VADPLVHQWTIGDLSVVRVADEDFALPSDRPAPEWCVGDLAPDRAQVGLAFSALAVRSADTDMVIDPWLANDWPRQGDDAADRAEQLLDRLAAVGFAPEAVDIVVNTHLDGVGWNTRPDGHGDWRLSFPNARYVYPAAEVAAIEAGENIEGAEAFARLAELTTIDAVDPPLPVAPGIELVDAPGHNFGHVAVRLESGPDLAIYPGHLVLTPFDIAEPDTPPEGADADQAVATRRAILAELAERDGVLLTTLLGGSGGGRVAVDGAGYRVTPVAR